MSANTSGPFPFMEWHQPLSNLKVSHRATLQTCKLLVEVVRSQMFEDIYNFNICCHELDRMQSIRERLGRLQVQLMSSV